MVTGLRSAINAGQVTHKIAHASELAAPLQAIPDPEGLVEEGSEMHRIQSSMTSAYGGPKNSHTFSHADSMG